MKKLIAQIIVISILAITVIVGILLIVVLRKKKEAGVKHETDYQALFVMGISFVGMGTALTASVNSGFLGITALGIIYMLAGLKNKDKWKKKE